MKGRRRLELDEVKGAPEQDERDEADDTAAVKDNCEDDIESPKDEDPKAKRKRGPKTTIQPNQLTILRTCFDKNPKPSPKIFEELSQDTGLTKRVIQVNIINVRTGT